MTVTLQHHMKYVCVLSQAVGHGLSILLDLMCVPMTILCLMLRERSQKARHPWTRSTKVWTAYPESNSQAFKWCASNTRSSMVLQGHVKKENVAARKEMEETEGREGKGGDRCD